MPDLSDHDELLTRCTVKVWIDQKECILKGVKKAKYWDKCTWLWVDDHTCTNPDAGKWKDGVK